MASHGVLPWFLSTVSRRFCTPAAASILVGLLTEPMGHPDHYALTSATLDTQPDSSPAKHDQLELVRGY